MTIFFSWC